MLSPRRSQGLRRSARYRARYRLGARSPEGLAITGLLGADHPAFSPYPSQIRALYEVEREISERALDGAAKRAMRATRSQPLVAAFFDWLKQELVAHALLPTNPFTKAAHYALARRQGLEVFLTDPDVPLDTNHLERALRPIPMGRKNWLFCWTELGAERVGQIQSLVTTCTLHGVDPYTYLVDVLQRIDTHPFSAVAQLTPRLWKHHFAGNPLRSLLHTAAAP